ncbi:hypothetical protein CYMTET_3793 [Cymbomonas tetramitiformis]|uniref:Uncharacterized protein n=1 Tax=Cymbomonas tetramitiformis TaxID=36881 RepID=A0AAE0H4D7_9CHLO|nr:hypothetical protein CYMTET_3793 [Cymbomonas tetramitiformis]
MMLRRSAARLKSVSGLCWGLSLLAARVRVRRRRERGVSRSESLPLELRGDPEYGGRCLVSVSGPELLRACLLRAVCVLPPTSVAKVSCTSDGAELHCAGGLPACGPRLLAGCCDSSGCALSPQGGTDELEVYAVDPELALWGAAQNRTAARTVVRACAPGSAGPEPGPPKSSHYKWGATSRTVCCACRRAAAEVQP